MLDNPSAIRLADSNPEGKSQRESQGKVMRGKKGIGFCSLKEK